MPSEDYTKLTRRQAIALGAGALLSACGRPSSSVPLSLPPASKTRFGAAAQPNIVVFLADALRADGVGCYNSGVTWTPTVDRFAETCIQFERCYSQCNWTKPSIGSIFTGVLPMVHESVVGFSGEGGDAENSAHVLRAPFATLAEMLGVVGYETAWFCANGMVHPDLGYRAGFNHVRFDPLEPPAVQMQGALNWLKANSQSPFFLFVHEIDPHGPYTPAPEVFTAAFGEDLAEIRAGLAIEDESIFKTYFDTYATGKDATERGEALRGLGKDALRYFRQLYDAEVHGVDGLFAQLLDAIEETGVADNTVVLFIADHGEAFGEHDAFGHAETLHNEELHVPLLIRLPGDSDSLSITHTVSLFDIYATLLTLGGAPVPGYAQSQSLLDADGNVVVDGHRNVFSEFEKGAPSPRGFDRSLILGDKKVLVTREGRKAEGFDLASDPGETRDILDTSLELQELRSTLESSRQAFSSLAETFGPTEWGDVGDDMEENLRALGYL